MAYILQNGTYYCFIDDKNAICKTQDINLATRFADSRKAHDKLHKASKKLKGYQVINLENNEIVEEVAKVKRRQFSSTERSIIYNKNKGRCAICGRFVPYDSFTVDHIIPLAKGGTNELDNLQCTCKVCNLIKQDILPEDLMEKLTEIILYQMKKSYNDLLWRKINYLRKQKQRRKIKNVIKMLSNRQ